MALGAVVLIVAGALLTRAAQPVDKALVLARRLAA